MQATMVAAGADWVCAADEDTLADLPSCIDGDIAKFDGAVWNCESGAPPDGGIGVLVDDDGATIGKIVSIIGDASIAVEVVLDFPPDQILLRVERLDEHVFRFNGEVFFASSDCTGTGYIAENRATKSRFFSSDLVMGFAVGVDIIDNHRLYIPSDDPPIFITTFSQLDAVCNASEVGGGRPDAVRAVLLESDLLGAYPKPYSVVLF